MLLFYGRMPFTLWSSRKLWVLRTSSGHPGGPQSSLLGQVNPRGPEARDAGDHWQPKGHAQEQASSFLRRGEAGPTASLAATGTVIGTDYQNYHEI